MRLQLRIGLLLLGLPAWAESAEINLSFYGHDSALVGCYSEVTDSEATLFLPGTVGPEFQGIPHYFGFLSRGHETIGCDLDDTGVDDGCSGYDLTAWFEPGSLVIGHVTPSDQNAMLEGAEWEGHLPTDFDAIRVEYVSGGPCDLPRTIVIPIEWVEDPVPTQGLGWGELKTLFRGELTPN